MTWDPQDDQASWHGLDEDDQEWAEGTAFDPDPNDQDADDVIVPPTAPLAQPGAYNLPYPQSPEEQERGRRQMQQWPYADAAPWDPDPTRAEREASSHTAPWPLPQPPPIAEPEP